MKTETKYIIGIVIIALLCSSVPIIVPIIFGMGIQGGIWSNQLLQSVTFLTFTKLSSLYVLISILGLALSVLFRKHNPSKFQVASISFTLLLLGTILTAVLSAWVDVNHTQAGASASQITIIYSSINCIYTLIQITAWVLILILIFGNKFNPSQMTGVENSIPRT